MTNTLNYPTTNTDARPADSRSLERFRLLVENSLDLIAEITHDGSILYFSPNARTILGYDPDAVVGLSVFDLIHPDDLAEVREYFALPEGRLTCRCRHANGTWRWFETTGRDFFTAEAQKHSVLVARDVTARQSAEEALRQSEERSRLLVDHAMDAVVILSAEGFVTGWNSQAERTFGWKLDQVFGKLMSEVIIPAAFRPKFRDGLSRILGAGEGVATSQRCELTGMCRDGREIPIELAVTLLPTSHGPSFSVFIRDLTHLRAAQQSRAEIEAQLRQAQKFGALGALAGGIAHDFNNILGAIIAYTDMVRLQTEDQPAVQEDLHQVLKASERARELIQQILTFSRRHKEERKPVRLQLMVDEALKLIRSTLPKTIKINLEVDEAACPVIADPIQLYQVLVNLMTNAEHAMRNRPGQLGLAISSLVVTDDLVSSVPPLKPGFYTRLSVSDTGHGMDAQTRQRIFEPCFTTKQPGEGTGLGLAVVQSIMREHDGAIEVFSEPGVGTTFHLYFPARATESTCGEKRPNQVRLGSGQRILVVDDEPSICAVMDKMLTKLGYQVVTHTRPAVALEQFRSRPQEVDILIANQLMPGMTGMDLAAECLRLRPKLPVLVTTGFDGCVPAGKIIASGILGIIPKPISLAELAAAVDAALHVRGAGCERDAG